VADALAAAAAVATLAAKGYKLVTAQMPSCVLAEQDRTKHTIN
jgi:hypothetical protein